jgi:hypothetical protein
MKTITSFFILCALVLTLATIAVACGEDENGGTATPLVTPAPSSATPVIIPPRVETGDWEGFREFAEDIEAALVAQDVDFFLDRAAFYEYNCPGPEEFTPCESAGQVLRVVDSIPILPSEATVLEADALRDNLQGFLHAAEPDLSDDYGGGGLRLYSISHRGGQEYWALITMISTRSQSPLRELMIPQFRFQDGRWVFASILQGVYLEQFGVEQYFSQAPEDLNWERRQQ